MLNQFAIHDGNPVWYFFSENINQIPLRYFRIKNNKSLRDRQIGFKLKASIFSAGEHDRLTKISAA